jgi:hypothetical protein
MASPTVSPMVLPLAFQIASPMVFPVEGERGEMRGVDRRGMSRLLLSMCVSKVHLERRCQRSQVVRIEKGI